MENTSHLKTHLDPVLVHVAGVRHQEQHVQPAEGDLQLLRRRLVRRPAHPDARVAALRLHLLGEPVDERDVVVGHQLEQVPVGAAAQGARGWEDADLLHADAHGGGVWVVDVRVAGDVGDYGGLSLLWWAAHAVSYSS